MNILDRLFKSRDKPQNAYNGTKFLFGGTSAGKAVNERTAMQTTTVYACVRILAETIAALPLHTYKYTNGGKEKAVSHPLYYLLHSEPNDEMTSFVFRETIMTHLLLWGNSYSQILRNNRGQIIGLYPLMPDRMTVDRSENRELRYTYKNCNESIVLNRRDILHIPGLGFDGIVGYSPIAMSKNAIGMALATEEYGSKFFANDASPGGVLEHPGVVKDPKRLRDSWTESYGGSGNSHKVVVLEEGLKFQRISIPPNEAQFLESRKFQVEEICRIFRIPPHLIAALDKATFSNIESQSISFIDNTILPWVTRLENSMQAKLLSEKEKTEYTIKFNLNGRLRGDAESRASYYQTMRQNGIMSANDIRELEEMNLISDEDGGNKYLVNGNFVNMATAGAWAEKYGKTGKENENE